MFWHKLPKNVRDPSLVSFYVLSLAGCSNANILLLCCAHWQMAMQELAFCSERCLVGCNFAPSQRCSERCSERCLVGCKIAPSRLALNLSPGPINAIYCTLVQCVISAIFQCTIFLVIKGEQVEFSAVLVLVATVK